MDAKQAAQEASNALSAAAQANKKAAARAAQRAKEAAARLRPILITSFALILGVLPLAISSGVGVIGRQILGTAVVGGTSGASVIGVFDPSDLRRLCRRVTGREEEGDGRDSSRRRVGATVLSDWRIHERFLLIETHNLQPRATIVRTYLPACAWGRA